MSAFTKQITVALLLLAQVARLPADLPEPAGSWGIGEDTGTFISHIEAPAVLTGTEGQAQTYQNRIGWAPSPDIPCETDALGDGWEALTIMADVFVQTMTGDYQGVVCRDRWGGATGDVFGLVITPEGKWAGRIRTAAGQCTVETEAKPGWHLVCLSYDGKTARLIIDGEEATSKEHSGALVTEAETPLSFGTYSAGKHGPFKGALHEIKVWPVALSDPSFAELATAWKEEMTTAQAAGFWFGQLSDTHLTDTKSVEIVNDGVDMLNADARIDFTLWLGDLTRGSAVDEMILARLALQRLTKPRYVLRGNHDQKPGVFEKEFGELRQRLDHGGWTFLLIDSNPGDKTPISQVDRDWLSEQLSTIPATTPIVLCTHHPLMPHTKSYLIAGASEVLALFAAHNLKACLSGHYHGNQQETVEGILFTTTACLSTTRNNFDGTAPKGYRLFHCREDTITTEFVTVPAAP